MLCLLLSALPLWVPQYLVFYTFFGLASVRTSFLNPVRTVLKVFPSPLVRRRSQGSSFVRPVRPGSTDCSSCSPLGPPFPLFCVTVLSKVPFFFALFSGVFSQTPPPLNFLSGLRACIGTVVPVSLPLSFAMSTGLPFSFWYDYGFLVFSLSLCFFLGPSFFSAWTCRHVSILRGSLCFLDFPFAFTPLGVTKFLFRFTLYYSPNPGGLSGFTVFFCCVVCRCA